MKDEKYHNFLRKTLNSRLKFLGTLTPVGNCALPEAFFCGSNATWGVFFWIALCKHLLISMFIKPRGDTKNPRHVCEVFYLCANRRRRACLSKIRATHKTVQFRTFAYSQSGFNS
eukprot:GEMP01086990.1.p1 GENE.GEMP01086990.1~~GEMP01086990.1.p1  ORF type:complete len:115 (-),score=0.06 GEMP01086990.1:592-936(-)